MSDKYLAMFDVKEKEYGIPAGYLGRTATIESNMNPTAANPNSTAKGLFQFIDSTAKEYNVDPLDPMSSTEGAAKLAKKNASVLRNTLGREPSAAELYLAHQQGATGASRLLSNPNRPAAEVVGIDAVKLNGGSEDMTAGEFANLWLNKFGTPTREETEEEAIQKLPEQVAKGEIDAEQAVKMALDFNISKNVLGLEPVDVLHAYKNGMLKRNQVEMYVDYKTRPLWFRTKDFANSVQRGLLEGLDGIVNMINDPINVILPDSMQIPDSPLHRLRPESRLTTGEITRELSGFLVPYAGVSKAAKVAEYTGKIMTRFSGLQKSHPIVYKGIEGLIHGTIAGTAADLAAFKPDDPGITNMMHELNALPEWLEFLMTDDDDPMAINRLRRVLEGAALGIGIEFLLAGARGFKSALIKKYSDPDSIARDLRMNGSPEVQKAFDDILNKDAVAADKAERKAASMKTDAPKEAPETPNKTDNLHTAVDETSLKGEGIGKGQDEIVPPGRSEEVKKSTSPEKNLSDDLKWSQDEQADRIFRTMSNDSQPVFHEDFLDRMKAHGLEDAQKLLKVVYRENHEMLAKVRGVKPDKVSEANIKVIFDKEVKKNAEICGQPLDFARKVWGQMKDASDNVQTLNEYYAAYAKQLNNKVKEAVTSGDTIKKLEALEFIKMFQELQAITYGVRAESGRNLRAYRRQLGSNRFDFTMLTPEDLKHIVDQEGADIDAALKMFLDAKGLKNKAAAARGVGKFRTLKGLLEYQQINLLWSPLTHIGNITSQAAIVAWKSLHRTIAGAIMYGISGGEMRHLAEVGYWYTGVAQGLVDAFRGMPEAVKGVGGILAGSKTFDEYVQDPKIGMFFKTQLSGKPLMETLMKDGILDMSDSALQSMFSKIPIMGKQMGYIFRTPFNFLASVDDAFKSVGWNAEAYSRMYRKAMDEGIAGRELEKWMSGIENEKQIRQAIMTGQSKEEIHKLISKIGNEHMPRDIIEEATYVGRDFTFQHQLQGGAKKFEEFLNQSAIGLSIRIMAMPFYRIMVNLIRWCKNNTIAGIRGQQVLHELQQGGIQRAETISRVVTGTAIASTGIFLAGLGLVTGELPKDMRQTNDNIGITDNSFWSGSKWVSMRRMEPISTLISIGANLRTAWNRMQQYAYDKETEIKFDDVFMGYVMALADPILNTTFMTSLKELTVMISDHERMNMEQYSKRKIETMFPAATLFNHLQRTGDDELVRTYGKNFEGVKGLLEVFNKHLDKSKLFPARHSVYGTPKKMEEPLMFIYNTRMPTADPVAYEMGRIGMNVKPIEDTYTKNGVSYKMTNAEYDELQEIVSKMPVQQMLTQVISMPEYKQMKDVETKAKILRKVITLVRSAAKEIWLSDKPEVQQDLIQKLQKRAKAIVGIESSEDVNTLIYNYQQLLQH